MKNEAVAGWKVNVRVFFVFALCTACCVRLPAQFGFRLMPSLNVPIGKEHFNNGFGASASLDWAFLPVNPRWKAGAALLGGLANFPVDYNNSFSILEAGLGPFVEWRLNDRWSLRGDINTGLYRYNWEDISNIKLFVGGAVSAQFHWTPFFSMFAEAGLVWHSFSDREPINNLKAGVGIQFNLNELLRPEARLRGEKTKQERIFPVIFTWYEKNSIAMLRIINGESNTITDIQLSFLLERYMNQAYTFASIERLGPGESVEIPVRALFNESMLNLTETVNAAAQVIAEYRSLGVTKNSSFPMQMPVYHRNAMTWDDDRRAAAFVSPRDPAAVYFARYVSHAISQVEPGNVPENVRIAAALFEALRLYGINYVLYSAASYVEKGQSSAVVDNMTYPYETLFYRSGACDCLSILFSAMLEALNVESAFITIPQHIFAAFDIGDTEWQKNNPDIIEYAGKRWLPVELTVRDRGFTEASRIGGRQWRDGGENAIIYPMHENWKVYPPVSVNAAGDNLPSMPERGAIAKAFEAELRKLR